jgi:cobalt/nickel transport system permease protein
MHLANEALTPECAAITWGAAALGLGVAADFARRDLASRDRLALAGGLGAMVLAAQAINVQILPGTSAHLVGGVLVAWAVGPGLGALVMALVLAIQALVLHDGGLLSLGANICNMALIPAGLVAAVRREELADWKSSWKPAALAAFSVPLAALCIAGQTALLRDAAELAGWRDFATRLVAVHLAIGFAEGALTLVLVAALAWLAQISAWRPALVATAAAAVLAVAAPLSSRLPDGYESAAERAGMSHLLGDE